MATRDISELFPPYPSKRADFVPKNDAEKFFGELHYDYVEALEKQGLSAEDQKKGLQWWEDAATAIQKFGANSSEVISIKYKAVETWGKEHPIAVGIISLIAGAGIGIGTGKI